MSTVIGAKYKTGLHYSIAFIALLGLGAEVHAQAGDVNCSKCVDTSDIALDAITSNRIKNESITNADIKKDIITGSRIKNESITNADIKKDTITGSRIKNGSITNADIKNGTIKEAKLAPNAVFERILLVRNISSDQVGNCTELLFILDEITDNDANNRYVIWLEPGIYDCGATSVQMKPFVDIQGSGRGSTLITGNVTGTNGGGVVRHAGNAELRNLSVRNVDGSVAVHVHQPDARVTDVRAEITGTPAVAYAFLILNFGGTAVITNVEADSQEAGSFSSGFFVAGGPNAVLVNVVSTAGAASSNSSGIQLSNGTVTVRNSALSGVDGGVIGLSGGGTANLVASQLNGLATVGGSGTFRCVGAYDETFTALNATCQ